MSVREVAPADWAEAVGVAVSITTACAEVDGQEPLDEAVSLRLTRGHDDGQALWLAGERGLLLVQDSLVSLAVGPEHRSVGLGAQLVDAASVGGRPGLEAWSHGNHPSAAALAAAYGWRRVRDLWVLRRPAEVPLPALPALDGVVLRAYDGSPHDLDELLRVNAAAFADHPEQGAMSAADVAERQAQPWWSPSGLVVATDPGGRWLGFHWTKQHSPALGEVYVVGIDPAAQGRGLGSLLTLAGLHHLHGLGVDEVLLYVEADNAPALAVYTKLGFTHAPTDTHVMYSSTSVVE